MFGARREGLSDDQRLIVSTVEGLAGKFGEAYWHRLDKGGKYPDEFVAEMGRLAWGHRGSDLGLVWVCAEFGLP